MASSDNLGSGGGRVFDTLKSSGGGVSDAMKGAAESVQVLQKALAGVTTEALRAVQASQALGALMRTLQNGIAVVQSQVGQFVAKLNPAVAQQFNMAVDDLYAAIGKSLLPVMEKATVAARVVGSMFNGLSGQGQRVVQALAAGTVGLVAFASAVALVQAVATGGVGPLVAGVAGALGGFFSVFTDNATVKGVLSGLAAALGGVTEGLGGVLEELAPAFGAVLSVVESLLPALNPVIALLRQIAGAWAVWAGQVARIFAQLAPVFTTLVGAAFEIVQAFDPIRPLLGEVFGAFSKVMEELAGVISQNVAVVTVFARVLAEVVRGVMVGVRSLLALVGISGGGPALPKSTLQDNTNLAARNVTTTSVDDVLRRAREQAYMSGVGGGNRPEVRTASGVEEMNKKIDRIMAIFTEFVGFPEKLIGKILMLPPELAKAILGAIPGGGAIGRVIGPGGGGGPGHVGVETPFGRVEARDVIPGLRALDAIK